MKSQRRCNGSAEIRGYRGYVLAGARATVPTHETPRTAWRARRSNGQAGGGREGRWNFGRKTRKRDSAEYAIFARSFFKAVARRPVARGRGEATDTVQMPEARCSLRGSLWDTVLDSCVTTYLEKSSAVTTKRRSMVGRGGVDGATIASHVVGAGEYGSAGTRLSERVTAGKRDETLVSSRR
ncbi:hypothetical protein QTP88_013030 [Uroleucon formosanum]